MITSVPEIHDLGTIFFLFCFLLMWQTWWPKATSDFMDFMWLTNNKRGSLFRKLRVVIHITQEPRCRNWCGDTGRVLVSGLLLVIFSTWYWIWHRITYSVAALFQRVLSAIESMKTIKEENPITNCLHANLMKASFQLTFFLPLITSCDKLTQKLPI